MTLLMCRPDYYGIQYVINPWMSLDHSVDQGLAAKQWETLYQTILSCGAKVELIPQAQGWPDMVFTANAGLYYKHKIVLPHFKHKERQGELPYLKAWFEQANLPLWNDITPETPFFEGAGDALLAGDKLFVGYGFRSEQRFYEQSSFFDKDKLILCELADPYFYHIDTCFCPLNADLAIWYPKAFTKDSQERMAKAIELIEVNEYEAKRFACNAVALGRDIILPSGCPDITAKLEQRGFTVHPCDMDEYLKAGGACKCLTLRID